MNALTEAHALLWQEFFWPLAAVVLAGLIIPPAGVHLVARRVPFLALALPQWAFTGMAAALALFPWWASHDWPGIARSFDGFGVEPSKPYLIAFAALGTAMALATLALLGRRGGGSPAGSHAATLYVAGLGLTEVFKTISPLGDQRLEQLMHGELLAATRPAVMTLALTACPVALMLTWIAPRLVFTAAESRVAVALGMRPGRWTAAFYVLFGTLVAATVTVIGPLPVFAFALGPAVIVRHLARSVRQLVILSATLGAIGAYSGAWCSVLAEWPMGASTVIATIAFGLLAGCCSAAWRTIARGPRQH